ncbi:hypothetical protein [Rhizobium leguminosarum]|nr:hypothetical protein [Rhizobium leguminosarum]
MASGVCRYHGGATPKGKGWHKPVWPADGPAFEKKLHRKLKTQERTRKRKSAKLNAMTDEERRQHDNWRRAHKIGSAAARRQAKEDRAQAASFRAMLAADEPKAQSLEALAVQAELEQARAKLDELMGVGIFG